MRLRKRAGVLIGLLIFQSCSSFILASYEQLLRKHTVVVFFMTMLVGAGGNAGNQAAVLVIRGIATGATPPSHRHWRNLARLEAHRSSGRVSQVKSRRETSSGMCGRRRRWRWASAASWSWWAWCA